MNCSLGFRYIVHMINKKVNIAFKYRITPNKEQKELFSKTFGCCRKVWNLMKADRDSAYQKSKETIPQEMKDLPKRHFHCECGYDNDRDINAALNIKREGLRILGLL